MYTKKRSGPRHDPCGTPQFTTSVLETWLSKKFASLLVWGNIFRNKNEAFRKFQRK